MIRKYKEKMQWLGKHTEIYGTLDSTNTLAKNKASNGADHGTAVVALKQTSGQGRRERNWQSDDGGLYTTVVLHPKLLASQAGRVTMLGALSVSMAIEEITDIKCSIKWPNDIWIGEKKVCGILADMHSLDGYIVWMVLGLGVNVNQTSFSDEVDQVGVSLANIIGKTIDIEQLRACIFYHMETMYPRMEDDTRWNWCVEQYRRRLWRQGQRVVAQMSQDRFVEGLLLDISADGALLLRLGSGAMHNIVSGDIVHLRSNEEWR